MNVNLNDNGTYPSERIDLRCLNRVLRHRLRNLCCGMKMALERVSDQTGESFPSIRDNCVVMGSELDNLLTFTQRMDLLFETLPAPIPMTFFQLLTQCRLDLNERTPICKLRMAIPDLEIKILPVSLVRIALDELLKNAAEGATNDKISLKWEHGKGLKFSVENTSLSISDHLVTIPPRPFVSHRGRHDGLGLAIIQRIADAIGGSFKFKQNADTGKVTTSLRIPVRHLKEG